MSDVSVERFARWLTDRTREEPKAFRFGDRKVFLGPLQDASGLSRAEFRELLFEARRRGLISLQRADLVGAMDPRLVRESAFKSDTGAEVHFVIDKSVRGLGARTRR